MTGEATMATIYVVGAAKDVLELAASIGMDDTLTAALAPRICARPSSPPTSRPIHTWCNGGHWRRRTASAPAGPSRCTRRAAA
jgi:hypothetical protein